MFELSIYKSKLPLPNLIEVSKSMLTFMSLHFQGFLADMDNPYLTGEKLHVAAKKGLGY